MAQQAKDGSVRVNLDVLSHSEAARLRVAVKRADDAPDIASGPVPDLRFEGRTSRIDVYLVNAP